MKTVEDSDAVKEPVEEPIDELVDEPVDEPLLPEPVKDELLVLNPGPVAEPEKLVLELVGEAVLLFPALPDTDREPVVVEADTDPLKEFDAV
ncbi:hypothetical protein EMMF5_005056 [Cystobasidiomycetes sp. EMM_F5]